MMQNQITREDQKPQGLQEVTEWNKQNIWMEQDVAIGIKWKKKKKKVMC